MPDKNTDAGVNSTCRLPDASRVRFRLYATYSDIRLSALWQVNLAVRLRFTLADPDSLLDRVTAPICNE
jgi:hypothetical protein